MSYNERMEPLACEARRKYGAFLRKQRELRKLTQKSVADHLGFRTPQLISNWERGVAVPHLKEIRKLAYLYAVDESELMSIAEEYQRALSHDTLDQIRQIFRSSKGATSIDYLDS